MKLKKITIEGMHNVKEQTYNLTNLNYLHGPNGAGKSTVLQAIQLALLGYIPGTHKSSKEAIFKHCNGKMMAVTLYIDNDGEEISICRMWTGTKSSISSSVEVEPGGYEIEEIVKDLELPIFNFHEFIDMTANKLKDWFLDFLPSANTTIDWRYELTTAAKCAGFDTSDVKLIDSMIDEIKSIPETGVDQIRAANEWFKSALSFEKKTHERLQATIQSLIRYDDIDMSTPDEEIELKLKLYEGIKSSQEAALKSAANNSKIKTQLAEYEDCEADSAELDTRYIKASKDYIDASNKIEELQNQVITKQTEIDKKTAELEQVKIDVASIRAENRVKEDIIASGGICPFTKSKCDSVQPMISEYRAVVESNNTKIAELDHIATELREALDAIKNDIRVLNNNITTLTQNRYEYTRIMSDIQNRYTMKTQLQTQIVIVPEFDIQDMSDDPTLSEFGSIDAVIDYYKKLQVERAANKKYDELIDTLTSQKYEAEQHIIAYKAWINLTGVNGLQNNHSAIQPFIDLEKDMDRYIQAVFGEDVASKFNLEFKMNSFSFGIKRDGHYIPFNLLSSGEKCMYTLSMMLSLAHVAKSPLKIVMVDDLLDHLDDVNINKLFESLENVDDVQMIFAGVKPIDSNCVIEVG